ncbi:MAG: signal peptidase I [Bacilli bacterium]|nr:signal peptidase I [Bacilli bacterium]
MIKKIFVGIVSGFSILLFFIAIFVLIIGSIQYNNKKLIQLFGYSYSVVATDSMEPTIMIGEIIIAKAIPYEDVNDHDIIVFFSNEHQVYFVHRINRVLDNGDFETKGDNPEAPIDSAPVTRDNYFGVVVQHGNFLNVGDLILKYRGLVFGIMIILFLVIIVQEAINIMKHLNEKNKQELELKLQEEKTKILEQEEKRIREEFKNKTS